MLAHLDSGVPSFLHSCLPGGWKSAAPEAWVTEPLAGSWRREGETVVSDLSERTPTQPAVESGISVGQLWETVLAALARTISTGAFQNWIRDTRLTSVGEHHARVQAPNPFAVSTLQRRYATRIERALSDVLGREVRVEFVVAESRTAPSPGPTSRRPGGGSRSARSGGAETTAKKNPSGELDVRQPVLTSANGNGLQPHLTFDTYVVGSSNALAHAAARNIAEQPGTTYNPFFVHGGVGLGKTHLMHAIGHDALRLHPQLALMYVTSETFTNEVIQAIRTQRMDEFRTRYRSIDILMVDDIQFIAGKESTQEEFFHTFNALYQNGKQVIVSSDKPPRAIAALEERMRSRFAGGLIVDVGMPDFEMRTAILRSKAEEKGINLPAEVVEYIAHRDQTNIRELEGALTKILMMAQIYGRRINLSLAMEALTDASTANRRVSTTVSDVIRAVCRHYQVDEKDIKGRLRTRDVVIPRQVAMYLLREETDVSLEEIGRAMGGRDHTTVLHGIRKIEGALDSDVALRGSLMSIREDILTSQ